MARWGATFWRCILPLAVIAWLSVLYVYSSRSRSREQDVINESRARNVEVVPTAVGAAPASIYSSHRGSLTTSKNAYATFLASFDFYPALQVFLYSLNKTRGEGAQQRATPLLICIVAGMPETPALVSLARAELTKYQHDLPWEIHLLPLVPGGTGEKDRWKINWTKLQLWSLVTFDKILFIDLDVLVLQPVHDAFDVPFEVFLGSYDRGKFHAPGKRKLNGGVFLLQPSLETLSMLLREKQREAEYAIYEVEQGLFNHVFASRCCLPFEYNVQKSNQRYWPNAWNLSSVKVLHYVGEKPWKSWSSIYFRETSVLRNVMDRRRIIDSWDADLYADLHQLWKGEYMAARKQDFDQLDFYVPPHARDCWRLMDGYGHGHQPAPSQIQPLDANPAPLKDAATEFVVLAAAVQTGSRAFVGVGSCSFQSLENRQGAWIDWTKVAFDLKTVYYWSAVYSTDYLRDVEMFHPGLLSVLKMVAPKLAVRSKAEAMEGFFVEAVHLVGPRSVLQEYTLSAAEALAAYASSYASKGSACAFASMRGGDSGQGGCLDVLLRVHLNLWLATRTDLHKVYAVDEDVISERIRTFQVTMRKSSSWWTAIAMRTMLMK